MPIMTVGAAELRAYASLAKACAPDIYASFRQGMTEAGTLVKVDVIARATAIPAQDPTGRIPASVRLSVTTYTATISAGGSAAPEAAPLNHEGQGGFFRHPVFATGDRSTWTWVSQPARPFLEPALEANFEQVADILADAVDDGFLKAVS